MSCSTDSSTFLWPANMTYLQAIVLINTTTIVIAGSGASQPSARLQMGNHPLNIYIGGVYQV
jgi:hypothetical protein